MGPWLSTSAVQVKHSLRDSCLCHLPPVAERLVWMQNKHRLAQPVFCMDVCSPTWPRYSAFQRKLLCHGGKNPFIQQSVEFYLLIDYLFFSHIVQLMGSQFPHQGLNPGPTAVKLHVLTPGPPRNSLEFCLQAFGKCWLCSHGFLQPVSHPADELQAPLSPLPVTRLLFIGLEKMSVWFSLALVVLSCL